MEFGTLNGAVNKYINQTSYYGQLNLLAQAYYPQAEVPTPAPTGHDAPMDEPHFPVHQRTTCAWPYGRRKAPQSMATYQ